jgi:hypothetical protein
MAGVGKNTMPIYDKAFYAEQCEGSRRSAKEIVPLILKIIEPKSVIDVGCGLGDWLSVFKECNVADILGVDGNYVNREMLKIPQDRFMPHDLKQPLRLERKYDLVMSLEVAEHLPVECAPIFVESLTRLGSIVLFSAAIPFQGGVNHINEQWPNYWADLFGVYHFVPIDCLREDLWNNDHIEWWYAQNIMIFAKPELISENVYLKNAYLNTNLDQLALVHPKQYLELNSRNSISLQKIADALPFLLKEFVVKKIRKLF